MTRQELAKELSAKLGTEKTEMNLIVNEIIDILRNSILKGETISIRGLFTISIVKKSPKVAQNICQRKQISIPERYAPHVKISKELRAKIAKIPIK